MTLLQFFKNRKREIKEKQEEKRKNKQKEDGELFERKVALKREI